MLKFKVTPNHKKQYCIFQSAKSLYDWMLDPVNVNKDECIQINIEPGEIVEYEWFGAEYIDESNVHILNLIRFVAVKKDESSGDHVNIPVIGWVCDGILPMKEYKDNVVTIEKIESGVVDFNQEFGCEIT